MANPKTSKPLPFYAAFLQGGDYILNVEVASFEHQPDDEAGYIKNIWFKYKNEYEFKINLWDQTFHATDNAKHFIKHRFLGEKKRESSFTIDIGDIIIEAISLEKQLNLSFKKEFFSNNPNIQKYYGAIIAESRLRYLDFLEEIII